MKKPLFEYRFFNRRRNLFAHRMTMAGSFASPPNLILGGLAVLPVSPRAKRRKTYHHFQNWNKPGLRTELPTSEKSFHYIVDPHNETPLLLQTLASPILNDYTYPELPSVSTDYRNYLLGSFVGIADAFGQLTTKNKIVSYPALSNLEAVIPLIQRHPDTSVTNRLNLPNSLAPVTRSE